MTKKLIYIFGSAVIGMLAVLVVVLTMIGTGSIGATPTRLVYRSATVEMAYDGSTLTSGEWELVSGELKEGHTASVTVSGSQTDVGESDNFISVVIHDSNGVDVTDHYAIEYQVGKLRVKPRSLELLSGSSEKVYDGTPIKNSSVELINGELMEGHSLTYEVTGELTQVGTTDNVFTVSIVDADGNDVKWKYDLRLVYGKLTVSKKELIVTSGSSTKAYDGAPLTNPEASYVVGALMEGHTVAVEAIGSITDAGEVSNTVKVTVTDKNGQDVTENYEIVRIEGVLKVTPVKITIVTASTVKVYDGKPTSAPKYELASEGGLLEGHKIVGATLAVTQTEAGVAYNELTDLVIQNSEGKDITFNYDVTVIKGIITVTKREIAIRTGSDSKIYDGNALTCDEWEIISITQLVDGHTMEIAVTGKQTEVGSSDNKVAEIVIKDSEGNSVKDNYNVVTQLGTLTVKSADNAEAPKPDEKGEVGGKLDTSGKIEFTDTDLPPALMLEIKSPESGSVYLKLASFGKYDGTCWQTAPVYNKLIGEKYGLSYLTGTAIENSGSTPVSLMIKSYTGDYVLPTYISMAEGEYTVQTSDTVNEGESGEYTVPYFVYSGTATDLTPNGMYTQDELLYREFVYESYLHIDDETEEYMKSIIDKEGFSKDDGDIVAKVASYIQNAAKYNLKYNKALDNEDNKVIAFLETYKEGICQHYASAATLLFRSLGIPARYTVGYSASTTSDTWAEVTSKQAHAWTEVYIDGIGWIAVEVTGSSSADEEDKEDGEGEGNPENETEKNGTQISGPDANMEIIPMLRIKSDASGTVYLRNMNYGDYTGKGWTEAVTYNKLLDEVYSMNYLASIAIANNGGKSIALSIEEIEECPYLLPYFTSLERHIYDIQISDTVYSGSENAYSMYYYDYVGYGEHIKGSLGEYADDELEYRKFVYSKYLTIDDGTKAYFDGVIEKTGFSKDDDNIIENVAEYIRNSAHYSLKYDRGLDSEDNIVIAFLDKYKEGICQHYASAGVMFYRALGIPARYVTGFMANAVEGQWAEVSNMQAHAWVEIYIDEIGWMPVEVTGSGDGFSSEDGYAQENKNLINVRPVNVYKKYDGKALVATNEIVGLEALIKEGYTYEAKVNGERTELGITNSTIESLIIYDKNGQDVTELFELKFNTGKVQVYISELTVSTGSLETVYDGLEHTSEECSYEGELSYGHKVSKLVTTGKALYVGIGINTYKIAVCDENGADVTSFYKINSKYGTLKVTEREIHIVANSDTKEYDGEPLVNSGYSLDGELGEKNFIEIEIKGSQTKIGKSENSIKSVKIVNVLNKDVTANYKITYENGVLFVTPKKK